MIVEWVIILCMGLKVLINACGICVVCRFIDLQFFVKGGDLLWK
jgi:hypothetical protein